MDELRIKVEQLIEDLENETTNRNMNDLEEGRYKTLCEVLDLIDEQKKWGGVMSRINKTQNNLQSVWDNLDLAYEHMEKAIEDLSQMTGLSDELERMVEQYDLSEISIIKQEVEELMFNADGMQRTTKIEDYRSGKIPL